MADYPEFTPPKGVELEGDSGEALVEWQRKPDGTYCFTSLDGAPLGSGEKESESSEESDYGADLEALAEEA